MIKLFPRGALLLFAASALPTVAQAQALPASVSASSDPATRTAQEQAYAVVHRYEQLLNKGDTQAIVELYAPDGIAEWNNKPTAVTTAQKTRQYGDLFKIAKFTTAFSFDAIDVDGDTAIVRTHHYAGATVIDDGKKILDKNREVFVLRKREGAWKILFYAFNTNPIQGVA